VRAFGRGLALCAMAWAATTYAATGDELVMPFACAVRGGAITLTPASPVSYVIHGRRDEQAFHDCGSGGEAASCSTTLVHRFSMSCAGGLVTWDQVADAGAQAGAAVPRGLPRGFAPMTQLQARIVLPALARFEPHKDSVSSEVLRADSVVYHRGASSAPSGPGTWTTVVRAEMRPDVTGMAFRVAGILSVLLATFFTLGLYLSRRPATGFEPAFASASRRFTELLARRGRAVMTSLQPKPGAKGQDSTEHALLNALSIANARFAEAELMVAALARTLAVRQVLQGELDAVRSRLEAISKGVTRQPRQKSAAQIRMALRELDRIARIAQGAAKDTGQPSAPQGAASFIIPDSLQEAYHILGLNGDAAPNVAKKLVDALRMTWHPDFARDDVDRCVREARMKQINAAWDLIKSRPAEAA